MEASEEESITELEIMPDGRIFIFGASRQILDILNQLQCCRDPVITQRHSLPNATDVDRSDHEQS
jgi:hypothetical protein